MSLNLGGDGVITGCTSLSEPALTLSGLTVDTDTFVVDSANDRVGIGTSSPSAKLDIEIAALTNNTSQNIIQLGDGGIGGAGITLDRYQNAQNYGLSFFSTAGTSAEMMRITNVGDVGIGTSSPAAKVQIQPSNNDNPASAFAVRQNNSADTSQTTFSIEASPNDGVSRLISSATSTPQLAFYTGGSESIRIDNSGYLRLTSNSPGLQFNGDTAAANALNDYEEGTWTPGIEGSTTAGSYTFTANGTYTKIGNKVTVWGRLLDITTVSAGSGVTVITGLPFTNGLGLDGYGSILLDQWAFSSSQRYAVARVQTNTDQVTPRMIRDNLADNGLDITAKANNTADIVFCVSYTVS